MRKTALEIAKDEISKAKLSLPFELKFDVTPRETVDKLLAVNDLTLPTADSDQRNIVGKIYDQVLNELRENNFPNITIVRGDPIVSVADNYDKLLFPPDNPGRSSTYTRYTDGDHVLRTQTSAVIPSTFEKLDKDKLDRQTFVIPGLVYRRDVIDPRHLDAFHQIDVWTLQDTEKYGLVNRDDLLKLVRVIFDAACPNAKMVVREMKHPYTVDGIEVHAEVGGKEIEILEAGLAHPEVLENSGIDSERFCGLASGMGIERLIMSRKNLPDIRLIRSTDPRVMRQMSTADVYKPVSDKPAISRDLSYCVHSSDSEEDICEAIREAFGDKSDLLEEVIIIERTSFRDLIPIARDRLGASDGLDNVLMRIVLRHPDKTLTKKESADLYATAYPKLHKGASKGYVV